MTEPLKDDGHAFYPKNVTSVVISPSQLSSIISKLPAEFTERVRNTPPHEDLPRPNLGDILGHEEMRFAFWRFLKSKYCDENISFMLAVDNLMEQENPELIQQQIQDIFTAYIAESSEQQVNLSHPTQSKIISKRNKHTSLTEFQTMFEK